MDSSKAASKSISSSLSNFEKASIDVNGDEEDESISEILEQCLRNAEDVESEFVRDEDAEGDTPSHGEQMDMNAHQKCRTRFQSLFF